MSISLGDGFTKMEDGSVYSYHGLLRTGHASGKIR